MALGEEEPELFYFRFITKLLNRLTRSHRRARRSPSGVEQLVAFFTLGRVGALSYGHIAFSDGNEVVNSLKLSQSSILEGGENPGSLHVVNRISTNMLSALATAAQENFVGM